jgi:hypothetical protein
MVDRLRDQHAIERIANRSDQSPGQIPIGQSDGQFGKLETANHRRQILHWCRRGREFP